jgi:hypothetical protein
MGNSYKAAFLIPKSSKKILDDSGWLFKSKKRLSTDVLDALKKVYFLIEKGKYLGVVEYVGDGLKVVVNYDGVGLIEGIFIQLHTRDSGELKKALLGVGLKDVELFLPEEYIEKSLFIHLLRRWQSDSKSGKVILLNHP